MRQVKRYTGVFAAALAALTLLAPCSSAASGEPYESYNYDNWGDAIPSQAGYTADRAVSGFDLGVGAFSDPGDIFFDDEGVLYITDTGNNRIIAADSSLEKVIKVYDRFTMPDGSETTLNKPMGVFVSAENGFIYIADSDNSRVLISDKEGNVQSEITKPESEVYDQKRTFLPQRVIADKGGNVYVVLGNITTGAAMFAPDGSFSGFYGANRVEPTAKIIGNYIKSIFMSDEKKAHRTRTVPSGITSFDIDGDFIFTCTASGTQTTDTVKKLNAAGRNIFANMELTFGDYTPMYDTSRNKVLSPSIVDIDVSEDGCINCLDFTTGRVFQYDEDCNLLFITGTIAKQTGGFDHVAAVESRGSELYVLDSMKDTITVFRETSFGSIVHEAAALHNAGYYEEALGPWQEVLKRDGNYNRAYVGVASALLRQGDYKGAMKYAKLADAGDIYNKAFEGRRREFLKENFPVIAAVIVLAAGALIVRGRLKKRHRAVTHKGEEEQQS